MAGPLIGFQIVLANDSYTNPRNPRYHGISLVPAVPSGVTEEEEPLDDYVFADYKALETNLIPNYARVHELWQRLAASPRTFEIILCGSDGADNINASLVGNNASLLPLGYDAANVSSDCWSILQDIPGSDWTRPYVPELNEHGLFSSRQTAARYLQDYLDHDEPDAGTFTEIAYLLRVFPLDALT